MNEHKFKVGQIVRVSDIVEKSGQQAYSVTRLLPAEKEGPQYRLKAADGSQERVVLERQLRAA